MLHPCFVLKKTQKQYFVGFFGKGHNKISNRYQLLFSQQFLAWSLLYCTVFNVVLNTVGLQETWVLQYIQEQRKQRDCFHRLFLPLFKLVLGGLVYKFVLKPSPETDVCSSRQTSHSVPWQHTDFTSQIVKNSQIVK